MFITFEGIEGCGKTTQIERLAKKLIKHGIPLIRTLEPGGTRIGKRIRRVLLDANNRDLSPLAELMLYLADRAQHVQEVIRPALEQGHWVLCDRFFDATVVYQGVARGQDRQLIRMLNEKVTQGIRPDITFILDCPAEVGLERALSRDRALLHGGQDRFEREKLEFHQEVRRGYLELASGDEARFFIMDATREKGEVEEALFQRIKPYLEA